MQTRTNMSGALTRTKEKQTGREWCGEVQKRVTNSMRQTHKQEKSNKEKGNVLLTGGCFSSQIRANVRAATQKQNDTSNVLSHPVTAY